MTGRRQRGLALVSVLWGIAILSLIAAAMLTASVTSAQLDRNAWNATRAGSIADAVVGRAILSLMDGRSGRQPRVDGTAAAAGFDGVTARLWIQDESGRINLNFADKVLLGSVFASAGLTDDQAAALADRVIARRAPQVPGGPAPPLAFRAIDALLELPGMTRALYAKIAPLLTVYGTTGAVDQTVAPPAVLKVLPGLDAHAIADLLRAREDALARMAAPGAAPAPRAASGATFTITAEVRVGTARVVRVATVQFTGDATKPYLTMAWR
ncbi:MAG: hypothetical protein WDM91_21680 [Rhizomicrobium sp.]